MQYKYKAKVIDVYDGDTITAEIDLGFGVFKKEKIRLYGIDAPEVRGEEKEEGKKSKLWLEDRILFQEITIETLKDKKGKYGRYLGKIFISGYDICELMIKEGMAVEYNKDKK